MKQERTHIKPFDPQRAWIRKIRTLIRRNTQLARMHRNWKLAGLFFSSIMISSLMPSCNNYPEIDLPEPEPKIVVDGWIESGDQAKVFLTSNAPYLSPIDSSSLRDLVLSRARVSLDDGENTEVLILRKDERYFPPYYYEGNLILGESGKTYTLHAEYGGKSVLAETTIPASVAIDTCYFELLEGEDSLGYIVLEFSDPPAEKNYYRIFTRRDGLDDRYIPSLVIALNDQHFSGEKLRFTLYRASKSYLTTEQDNYFRLGETIEVKLLTMDRASFEFWNSYQDEVLNSTNPFASSLGEIRSNIGGDGLGVWCGYGISTDTIETVYQ
jgi:hypothetical protein